SRWRGRAGGGGSLRPPGGSSSGVPSSLLLRRDCVTRVRVGRGGRLGTGGHIITWRIGDVVDANKRQEAQVEEQFRPRGLARGPPAPWRKGTSGMCGVAQSWHKRPGKGGKGGRGRMSQLP